MAGNGQSLRLRCAGVVGMRSRASGVARLENVNKGLQDRIAQRNNKGKFPDVQPRSRGSATLPRHARRYADTPTRRHASPTPVARERNPTAPRAPIRRYADTPPQPRSRGSATLPRHARRHADTCFPPSPGLLGIRNPFIVVKRSD
jgi:hypothetical protein